MINILGLKTLVPGWPLALFRIAFGLLYLDFALQKAPWIGFGWLRGWIEKEIATPAFPWYATLLREVVLPNFTAFAMVSFLVEMALGVALLVGVMTRLAGLAGFFWQINIALGSYAVPGEWYWIWPLLTLPQFCFAFGDAGRVLGVDAWLEPRLRARAVGGATWAGLLHHAT
ncbi:MAG TPA: TQO small subunit DoxD [Methylomirabilota bacterium]|nr:TQO small subunit DoxD [Methylomirabilota bacterium]